MCTQNLNRLAEKLVCFEKTPKLIQGRQITDWFKLGEDIFTEFYKLGTSVQWNYSSIKNLPDVTGVVTYITNNQEWLQTFINLYPNLRVDLDLVGSAGDVCRVRSGIEVLLRGFTGVNNSFDTVLKNLEELGEVDELDRCLKIWVNTGHRPDFTIDDKKSSAPSAHWWWH